MFPSMIDAPEGLSPADRQKLIQNLERAREFEHEEARALQRHRAEGPLLKFTNVVKGYQYRYFMLNPETLTLEYFEKEEHKNVMKPRGSLSLAYASVCPSDEDSQTFVVNASSGEVYKLKAADARQRQEWVDRIRTVAHFQAGACLTTSSATGNASHTSTAGTSQSGTTGPSGNVSTPSGTSANANPSAMPSTSFLSTSPGTHEGPSSSGIRNAGMDPLSASPSEPSGSGGALSGAGGSLRMPRQKRITVTGEMSVNENFSDVKALLRRLQFDEDDFDALVDKLPQSNSSVTCLDKDILEFRAISRANLASLRSCLAVLERKLAENSATSANGGTSLEWAKNSLRHLSSGLRKSSTSSLRSAPTLGGDGVAANCEAGSILPISGMPTEAVPIDHEEDVEDAAPLEEQDLGSVEEHKSVILHIISQLKLGMDLTKVVLPTFILEKRSLLEMFADCMAHPQLFLRIPDAVDSEARMIAVLEWYLTSFHAGRKGSLAKKPYNPIIGETFHCSWLLNETNVCDSSSSSSEISSSPLACVTEDSSPSSHHPQQHRLIYCAEQVSHHPPITAFYFECLTKGVSLNASIYTKSKFQGISICAAMVGKLQLYVSSAQEEYQLSLPSVYARSILTVPWVELSDKVSIHCPQTKYSAAIVFHTKPFYGGKLHRVSAEVKNPAGVIVCKAQGEWNHTIEFDFPLKGEKRAVNVNDLQQYRKQVRLFHQQGCHESRQLWHNVTEALKSGNLNEASKHKHQLEQRQRESEKLRLQQNLPFPVKYFKICQRSNSVSLTPVSAQPPHQPSKHTGFESWIYHKLPEKLGFVRDSRDNGGSHNDTLLPS